MKVAYVGVKRNYQELAPTYVRSFNKYHLELPFYYAELGGNDVVVTTTNYTGEIERFPSGGSFKNESESSYLGGHDHNRYDVVVHWRKWFHDLYNKDAYNVLHACDHSYSQEWKNEVVQNINSGKLKKIICYDGWHRRQIIKELSTTSVPNSVLEQYVLGDMTLGVDTSIYHPSQQKDRHAMLWSSDPGRGLTGALDLAAKLHARDQRFVLHICYPDYSRISPVNHPAFRWHGFVPNGPKLWSLFNETGIVPYTSGFMEPGCRVIRQGQAAGSLVLYPPGRGYPSEFIVNQETGIVSSPETWINTITKIVEDDGEYERITSAALAQAKGESWEVQAERFNNRFQRLLGEEK